MRTLVPCPNAGRCGSQQHEPHSQAFKDCMKAAHRVMSDSPGDLLRLPTPAVADGPEDNIRTVEHALSFGKLTYSSDHLIEPDDHLDPDQVQMYLDGDDDLYTDIEDDYREAIRDDVDNCLDEMLEKVGIDPEYVDEYEREDLISEVSGWDEADLVKSLAENTPQRLLRTNSSYLEDAYENAEGEYGSPEWFDSISSAVWDRDVVGVMDWESEEQKSQDKADFQAAFRGIDPDFVNEEMTSGLMWTGSIMDAAPSYRADKELDIYSPSVAFVNSANGVFSNTGKLRGTARITIPNARKDAGLKQRVIDDESEGMFGSVKQMGGMDIAAFRSRTLASEL